MEGRGDGVPAAYAMRCAVVQQRSEAEAGDSLAIESSSSENRF